MDLFERADAWIRQRLWAPGPEGRALPGAPPLRVLRLVYATVREVLDGKLNLQAMSLVYTTLLAMVPLLAVSFSVLKAFGVHNRIEPVLYNFLAPLGPKGAEITGRIVEFVGNLRVGVLGSVGLVLLIYTVISLLHKIEEAFNGIWRVQSARSFARRFSDYMSVILVGPLLIFGAMGLTASLTGTRLVQRLIAVEPLGSLYSLGVQLAPYVLVCLAFSFVYAFVPNTRVRTRSAAVGGVVGGILWQSVGWGFASFIVTSTKYAAIYSSFAILVFFMIWLYLSWLILLVGVVVSFFHQHQQFLAVQFAAGRPAAPNRERLALLLMYLVGHHFYHREGTLGLTALVDRLGFPAPVVCEVVEDLLHAGLLIETGDESAFLPGRALETIAIRDILDAVRHSPAGGSQIEVPEVSRTMERIEASITRGVEGLTLRDMVLAEGDDAPD